MQRQLEESNAGRHVNWEALESLQHVFANENALGEANEQLDALRREVVQVCAHFVPICAHFCARCAPTLCLLLRPCTFPRLLCTPRSFGVFRFPGF